MSEGAGSEEAGENRSRRAGGFRLWMLVPAIGAAMVVAVFMLGLHRENADVLPSALVDRPVPDFTLKPLREGEKALARADLSSGGVKLVNIWASWCGPCRVEHPQLMALAESGIPVHGINYKDKTANALDFLNELGDPYTLIGADTTGRTGIDFGVYGVPETFIVDGNGVIIHKHVGPITKSQIESEILPAIEKASAGS